MDEDTYTPLEAARILRLSRRRVTQMLNAGELEGCQDESGGGTYRNASCTRGSRIARPGDALMIRNPARGAQEPPRRPPSSGKGEGPSARARALRGPSAAYTEETQLPAIYPSRKLSTSKLTLKLRGYQQA